MEEKVETKNDQYWFRMKKRNRRNYFKSKKQIFFYKNHLYLVDLEKSFNSINWTNQFNILEEAEIEILITGMFFKK